MVETALQAGEPQIGAPFFPDAAMPALSTVSAAPAAADHSISRSAVQAIPEAFQALGS
jgi:hypothetical protein